jgi:hypothetical protein
MKRIILSIILVITGLGLTNCTQQYLPISESAAKLKIPAQQLLIANAANKAFEGLNFKPFKGRIGLVETVGVFPPTDNEFMDYLKASLEAKLGEAGVVVIPCNYDTDRRSSKKKGEGSKGLANNCAEAVEAAEYRFVLVAEAAGGDLRYESGLVTYIFYTGQVRLKVYAIPTPRMQNKLPTKIYHTEGREEQELGSVCCWIIPLQSNFTPQKQVLPPNLFSSCLGSISGMCGTPQ